MRIFVWCIASLLVLCAIGHLFECMKGAPVIRSSAQQAFNAVFNTALAAWAISLLIG